MGLLRFLRGKRSSLDGVTAQDGSVYVCTDDGTAHFDYLDDDGNIQRKQLNAGDSTTLSGASLSTSLNPSDLEIPTSNAVIQQIPTKVGQLENDSKFISEEYVEAYFKRLNSDNVLRFYCIEDVTVVINGVSTLYPANSNVEVKFLGTDEWELIPTSNNSILVLNAFPGALGTYYSWLEGVKQFSNILFDMNNEDFYSKWSQGNQGAYQVQFAQYLNCIFWSDNPYISEVTKRTNYTLYYTSQLPLCYSSIPDNTFKAFYLAFNVNSDPNWGNKAYRDSFAKATWATQVFSYYGARTIGIFGHDDPDFNIVLPKDCRGLMSAATATENAGTFDAINVTNFGAKSGSWRDAFGWCTSLRNLYIKNLKVNLNISWSPLEYDSISYIISTAANTNKITISVSPYTYYLLSQADFDLATSKNIVIELLTTNYVDDKRLSAITLNGDGTKVLGDDGTYKTLPTKTSQLENDNNFATESFVDNNIVNKKEKDLIVSRVSAGSTTTTHSVSEMADAIDAGRTVRFLENVELFDLLEINRDYGYATFYMLYVNQSEKLQSQVITIVENEIIDDINNTYDYALKSDVLLKSTQTLTDDELTQVRSNLKFIGKDVAGQTFNINGEDIVASANAEIFGDYTNNKCTGQWSIVEGSENIATGRACHVEGAQNQALNDGCHVEGVGNKASGYWSHAEGERTIVTSYASHAEGSYTKMPDNSIRYGTASGYASHVEGGGCQAQGSCSHSEGLATTTKGNYSHSEGRYTIAGSPAQHVEGIANIEDTASKYIHIAGNGDFNAPSNAYHLDWNGNGWFSGDVYVGSTSGIDKDEGSKKLATEELVNAVVEDAVTWGEW